MKKILSAATSFLIAATSVFEACPMNSGAKETKNIENFESYTGNAALAKAYTANKNGDPLELSLVSDSIDGSKALKYDYTLKNDGSGYCGATKSIGKSDWSSYDGLTFMINADGSNNATTVQFVDSNGIHWECSRNFSSQSGWIQIEIPFSEFKVADWESSKPASPDLKSVTEFSIYANKNDGTVPVVTGKAVTTTTTQSTSTTTTTTTTVTTSAPPIIINHDGSMHVSGNKLYDGDGNEFVMKGVNIPHDWYTDYTKASIDAIANLGANTARIVLGEGTTYTKTTKQEVQQIITWCKQRGLVCILEIHDFTGSDDPSNITVNCVNYWKEMMDVINANKDYVIVNIANEWQGTWEKDTLWADTYEKAVTSLRDAGLKTAIMVDASGYGQETKYIIRDCKKVLAADKDANTIFSLHMYSCVGKDSTTISNAIDGVLDEDVCLAIGEFGYWQNFNGVDERYLVDYCDKKDVGWLAWSWKGNGGYDAPLDMSNDWAGTNLTEWGKWVFAGKKGIQETSKLAYSLKGYTGTKSAENVPDSVTDPDIKAPEQPVADTDVPLSVGVLNDYKWTWGLNGNANAAVSSTTSEKLSNGGIRANVDLTAENYPTLISWSDAGYDLSSHKTIDLVVRNNNSSAVQLDLILKAGNYTQDDGSMGPKWYEPNTPSPYINIPGGMTEQISFDISKVGADLSNVKQISFRIQPSSGKINQPVDICSMGFDLASGLYENEISEMNRPKSASYFTWSYPDTSFTATTSTSVSSDGVMTIKYDGITDEKGAGIQTETRPGLGLGLDFTKYKAIKATLTNKGTSDVHCTLIVKNGSGWTWAENGGTAVIGGKEGEMVVPAGKSVDVYYYLNHPTWKTKASDWEYTDSLTDLDDVRAIAFKLYTSGESASGTFEISKFEVLKSEPTATVATANVINAKAEYLPGYTASNEQGGTWYFDNIGLYKGVDEPLYGDANCDGKIDISDVVAVRRYLINAIKYPVSADGIKNADANGDGINAQDAVAIQKYVFGITTSVKAA
ncbi:MAG: CIA30 family protein [Ruminococcus sp.]|jgi:hypothetical protein|nr:CIA30 family protein [Ruminococcus sp.]